MEDLIVLSRYFHNNSEFVAGMCPLRYEKCTEVRIVGLNIAFLKKFQHFTFEDGFSQEEVENDSLQLEKFNNYLQNQEKDLEEISEKYKSANIESLRNLKDCRILQVSDTKDENNNQTTNEMGPKVHVNAIKDISKDNEAIYQQDYDLLNVKEHKSHYFIRCEPGVQKSKNFYENLDNSSNNTKPYIDFIFSNKKKNKKKLANIKQENNNDFDNKIDQNNESNISNGKSEQKEFISNFLFSDFEFKYLGKQKSDISQFPWCSSRSPHNLIEETLYNDPWALLIATIFLNRTSCLLARPYVFWFLSENPDPHTVLDKFPADFEKYFINLGLKKTRAIQVYRMSHDFLFKPWKKANELYGIGEYGECAYRMFCLGDFSVEPKDRFLKIYKAWHSKLQNKKLKL